MRRILLPLLAVLVACAPSPGENAVSNRRPAQKSAPNAIAHLPGTDGKAAQGPIPEAVSAAGKASPAPHAPLPPEAQGRKTLSTAFVRVDARGQMTIELHDGRVLTLRDVVMRPKNYCGTDVSGNASGQQFCGGYADVKAARPGRLPVSPEAVSAAANALPPHGD